MIALVVAVIFGDDLGDFAQLLGYVNDESLELAFFLVHSL